MCTCTKLGNPRSSLTKPLPAAPAAPHAAALLRSYNMLPALLKYSSAAAMLQRFPPEDRRLHEEEHEAAASAPLAENRAIEWNAAHDDDDDDDADMGPAVFAKGTPIDASLLDLLAL